LTTPSIGCGRCRACGLIKPQAIGIASLSNWRKRFHALAAERPDPNDRLSGEGMIGVSQLYLGDLSSARRHLEHMLVGSLPTKRRTAPST
jgi:hypothetical protein